MTFPTSIIDLDDAAWRLPLTLLIAVCLMGSGACHAAAQTQVSPDTPYLRIAAELRTAIEQGRVEELIGAMSPEGLKVGDSSIPAAVATAELRHEGKLYAKFFDTAKRRQALRGSPLASRILSVRDWFLANRDSEMVVERQGPEVLVWFRPKGSLAELDDLLPCFTFCDHSGQPKLCRPPDDT